MLNKKGQITIFVILAIVIVIGGISYFAFRDVISVEVIPVSVEPVKIAILDCIESKAEMAISILESSGGYIETPEFKPGSRYQPFSSELDFIGTSIPYWFYMSAANIPKSQVPTIESMEIEIANFLDEEIESCYLEDFRDDGYLIDAETPRSSVIISENYVDINVDMEVLVSRDNEAGILKEHEMRLDTNLGYLFNEAKSIYDEEQRTFFLENYTIDVLRLYAPVDGVELSCSPMSWQAQEIYTDVKEALEENTRQLSNRDAKEDYFNLNLESDADVKFMYLKDWTTYFEVNPTNDNVLVAKPVGKDQGMGILGFCYVPYHFVYNLRHPVLVQVSKDDETFQFPMAVLIEGNLPRKSAGAQLDLDIQEDICESKNSNMKLTIYDEELDLVDAQVSYECIGVSCDIDYVQSSEEGMSLPQCMNGVLRINADGYKPYRDIVSSVDDSIISIILEREYNKDVSLIAAGTEFNDKAIITFVSGEFTKTLIYPQDKEVSLFSGDYEIQIYLYKESELKLESTTTEECYTVPRSGLLGLAGLTREECSTVDVAEQVITDALIGGGNADYYFSKDELKNSNTIELSLDRIIVPETLEELQQNYLLFDVSEIEVNVL